MATTATVSRAARGALAPMRASKVSVCPRCNSAGGMFRDLDGFAACAICGFRHYLVALPDTRRPAKKPGMGGQVQVMRYIGPHPAMAKATLAVRLGKSVTATRVLCPFCPTQSLVRMRLTSRRGLSRDLFDGEAFVYIYTCKVKHSVSLALHPKVGWHGWW